MQIPSIIETRRHQIFPTLEPPEIERVRRFGEVRAYGVGEALVTAGQVGPGLMIVLAGKIDVTQRDENGRRELIVTHGPGAFTGGHC
jgi:thioredoxin reductase (NADPH)